METILIWKINETSLRSHSKHFHLEKVDTFHTKEDVAVFCRQFLEGKEEAFAFQCFRLQQIFLYWNNEWRTFQTLDDLLRFFTD